MKLIKIGTILFKVSALACLIAQTNSVMAGSVNVCNGVNSAEGPSTTQNVVTGCTGGQGVSIYEWNYGGGLSSNSSYAGIGIGISDSGAAQGEIYINAPNGTTINSTVDMKNHQINGLANAILDSDAVNLGQMKALAAATLDESKSYTDTAKADAISQSNAYTDTAKVDAISQSNAYTDTAKADAISQSNAYTDTAKADAISQSNAYTDTAKADAIAQGEIYTDQGINKLSDQVIHYDSNADGTPNKNAVTLAGGSNGTTLSNVANGQVNANSKDAVNGSQLNATNQALADYLGGGAEYNTTTQSFTAPTFKVGNAHYNNIADTVTALDYRIDGLAEQVNTLDDKLKQGLAMSAAMAGLFQPYGVGKFNVSMAGGGYGSQGAIALGSGFRFNETVAMKAGLAAIPGKGKATYNMGVNFEW